MPGQQGYRTEPGRTSGCRGCCRSCRRTPKNSCGGSVAGGGKPAQKRNVVPEFHADPFGLNQPAPLGDADGVHRDLIPFAGKHNRLAQAEQRVDPCAVNRCAACGGVGNRQRGQRVVGAGGKLLSVDKKRPSRNWTVSPAIATQRFTYRSGLVPGESNTTTSPRSSWPNPAIWKCGMEIVVNGMVCGERITYGSLPTRIASPSRRVAFIEPVGMVYGSSTNIRSSRTTATSPTSTRAPNRSNPRSGGAAAAGGVAKEAVGDMVGCWSGIWMQNNGKQPRQRTTTGGQNAQWFAGNTGGGFRNHCGCFQQIKNLTFAAPSAARTAAGLLVMLPAPAVRFRLAQSCGPAFPFWFADSVR
ncbi:MAG: hypothetical protein UZ07_CHB004002041 [Chlorobi bacterium OLB7]|nr:MAG: hypothetical protein UZ07_CHB004002041 [Chlorobi bacterium OLB7]